MARKTKEVVVPFEGRDHGKRFFLTEMASSRAEKWAVRALLAMSQAGVPIPEGAQGMGMVGLLKFGLEAALMAAYPEADALLAELMTCIQFAPNAADRGFVRPLIDDGVNDEIEEVRTRFFLRSEVFELHTGFSIAAFLRERAAGPTTDESTSDTSTSPSP